MEWFAVERGEGRPLVLLHGIGMASSAWGPVLDRLAAERRAIALDIPGFGRTPALPADVEPTPAAIAHSLVQDLVERGVDEPFEVVGNSLGGFVALEVAKAGHAQSVVALSPAGLWHGQIPRWTTLALNLTRAACRHAPRLTRLAMRTPAGRTLGLLPTVAWKGWRVPANEAVKAAEDFASGGAFEDVLHAASEQFRDGQRIDVPVTIAFGRHDLTLRKRTAQFRDQLPPHTTWLTLPGAGHVPMWDNPEAVTQIILGRTRVPSPIA